MMLIDGRLFEPQVLPMILFGSSKPLAYVLNPKVASTFAMNFVFFANHGYRFFEPFDIYRSRHALLRFEGPEMDRHALKTYYSLAPETFSFVRDPLQRFISGFLNKVFTAGDPHYFGYRDQLTSLYGIDLSPEADPRQSIVAFARLIAATKKQGTIDVHFRPQHLNLAIDSRFTVETILRLEEPEAMQAFCARWVGVERAKELLAIRMNERPKYTNHDVLSDELIDLVRTIYAKDYAVFYSGAENLLAA